MSTELRINNKYSLRGQAVIEFILLITIIASMSLVVQNGIRPIVRRMWVFYIQKIAAPCPGCPPDPLWR